MALYKIKSNINFGKKFYSAEWVDIAIVEGKNKEEALLNLMSPDTEKHKKVVKMFVNMTGDDTNSYRAFRI